MPNDETRDTKTPDRQDAPIDPNQPLQTHLAYIDSITRALLAQTTPPNASAVDHLEPDQRRELRRHLRQIRAEASRVGLLAIGPEASMPYRPDASNVLTYSGPDEMVDTHHPVDHSDDSPASNDEQTPDDHPESDDPQPTDDHDTEGEPDE